MNEKYSQGSFVRKYSWKVQQKLLFSNSGEYVIPKAWKNNFLKHMNALLPRIVKWILNEEPFPFSFTLE